MAASDLSCEDCVGKLVWAKLPGWPWWPARVHSYYQVEQVDVEEKKPVIVRFFGSKNEM